MKKIKSHATIIFLALIWASSTQFVGCSSKDAADGEAAEDVELDTEGEEGAETDDFEKALEVEGEGEGALEAGADSAAAADSAAPAADGGTSAPADYAFSDVGGGGGSLGGGAADSGTSAPKKKKSVSKRSTYAAPAAPAAQSAPSWDTPPPATGGFDTPPPVDAAPSEQPPVAVGDTPPMDPNAAPVTDEMQNPGRLPTNEEQKGDMKSFMNSNAFWVGLIVLGGIVLLTLFRRMRRGY